MEQLYITKKFSSKFFEKKNTIYKYMLFLVEFLLISWSIISYFLIVKKNKKIEDLSKILPNKNINNKEKSKIKTFPKLGKKTSLRFADSELDEIPVKIRKNFRIANINSNEECEIGNNEKCKTCSHQIKQNCLTCNEGYYLPYHKMYNRKCLPCNKTEHCNSCFGEKNYIVCTSCDEGYTLSENLCIIPSCVIGENEKCKTCNKLIKNECQTCNEGFYLPSDGNKKICEKCKINNCEECSGTIKNPICLKCKIGFELYNNNCEEQKCIIGNNEKCTSCSKEKGKEEECGECNDGYFIPTNSNLKTQCSKCSLKNCKKCSGKLNNDTCLECNNNYITTKNQDGLIEYCSLPPDKEYNNWMEIEYNVTNYLKKTQLMNTLYTKINLNEIDIYENENLIYLSKDPTAWDKPIFHKFDKNGLHKVKINIKKTLKSMAWMFTNLGNIKSIKFLPGFDSSQVTSIDEIFACGGVQYLDLNYLNTSNFLILNYAFEYSSSLVHLNLSSFNTLKAREMTAMFYGMKKIKELDLSSFDTSNIIDCVALFHEFPINCTIIISNKFTKCREQIPYENKNIINIDELLCKKFYKCNECSGSKENLYCIKCDLGYELKNNICVKSECDLGENNKCLSCQTQLGKEKECLDCNDGYYLTNSKTCEKCPIDGCKICQSSSNDCNECKLFYEPELDITTNKIINCKLICDIGQEDKCATCNLEQGKISQCSSCNPGYRLMKNGKCKKIENYFIGIYNITSKYKFTRIMCVSENGIKLSDFEMFANGTKVAPYLYYGSWRTGIYDDYIAYIFPTLGKVEVKIVFNKTLTNMKYLFVDCYDLISINFSDTFDTSHVICMYYMFSSCDSLKYINISSFNTSLVGDMEGMFNGLDELTSLDLSNFDTKNVYYMQCIFAYSEKLSYLDISSFDTTFLRGSAWMMENVAPNGTIIVGKKYNLNEFPPGWTVIHKD